jgi:hypothetical protein
MVSVGKTGGVSTGEEGGDSPMEGQNQQPLVKFCFIIILKLQFSPTLLAFCEKDLPE